MNEIVFYFYFYIYKNKKINIINLIYLFIPKDGNNPIQMEY